MERAGIKRETTALRKPLNSTWMFQSISETILCGRMGQKLAKPSGKNAQCCLEEKGYYTPWLYASSQMQSLMEGMYFV